MRPCQGARPSTTSRATSGSWVTSDADQAALAAGRQRDRLVRGRVGRAPCRPGRTARRRAARWRAGVRAQQHGGQERAALGVGVDELARGRVAVHDVGGAAQRLDRLAHLVALVEAGQRRPCARLVGRVADGDLGQPRDERLDHLRPPWRSGTSTRRIAVHFCPALTVISVTTPLTKRSNSGSSTRDVRAQDRAVQRVGLDAELDAAVQHRRGAGAGGRRCAAEPVNATESCTPSSVEQAPRAAAEQLQRAFGQQAGAR